MTAPAPSPTLSPQTPAPPAIAADLGARVVGQDGAIREMSIALSKKLAGLSVGNLLMIGSSGTGKTTLMRAVEDYLGARPALGGRAPVVRMHANVLGEEAQRGRPGEAVLGRLLERSREQLGAETPLEELLAHAGRGLIFVDEVDKIRAWVGDQPNTSGIRAQEALLTVMENEAVPFQLPRWAGGESITVDSSGLLFVCAGAFEGLHDTVYDRVTVGADRGALKPVNAVIDGKVVETTIFHLRDWLRNEDLFDYGMSPQFLSRFDAVVMLSDLQIPVLEKIFLESPDSGFQQSRGFFKSHGLELLLSRKAVRRIAEEAHRNPRLGARALKEVFRRVMRDIEFDPASAVNHGDRGVLLDLQRVEEALAGRARG